LVIKTKEQPNTTQKNKTKKARGGKKLEKIKCTEERKTTRVVGKTCLVKSKNINFGEDQEKEGGKRGKP